MKILAALLNFLLLIAIFLLTATEGFPKETEYLLFVLLIFITPIITLFVLFHKKSDSWFSLFLKRKAEEEKKRISELKKEKNPES